MKKILTILLVLLAAVGSVWAGGGGESASGVQYIKMYYPVGVAGPLAQLMNDMVSEFNESQDQIVVEAIFAGGYTEALEKTSTAVLFGNPPALAVLDAPNLLSLRDIDAIIPLDPYIEKEGGSAYTDEFVQGFLEIARADGKLWSIPWQRSTPLFYYNKDHFREAGLDPDNPPQTWDELRAAARALVQKDSNGNVTQWGLEIPINFWLLKPLVLQAGGQLDNEAGTALTIDTPEMREVLGFLNSMVQDGSTPRIKQWAESVSDFAAGATSMVYNSTGALTYIRTSMTDEFGTAFLPAGKNQVVIEGGGNFFIMKSDDKAKQDAAWEFIKWMTRPENTARWSLGSGYIPVKPAAFDVPEYKAYTDEWPQALTAYRQLQEVRVERNLMTHNVNAINNLVNTTLEAILAGKDVDTALQEAQADADKILRDFN
jgi:sn-glycerol 3-phosphate transport system substrate-binding protein